MAVQVDKVQQVTGGWGFNIKADGGFRWMTVAYKTEAEAIAGREDVEKGLATAVSARLP